MRKLAGFRVTVGLTQDNVADTLNITQGAVSAWERGEGYPSLDKVQQLADLYKVTVQDIIEACMSIPRNNITSEKQLGRDNKDSEDPA